MINKGFQIKLLAATLIAGPLQASDFKYNASDVIRYALTSHGITYLLMNKKGTLNRWKHEPEKANKLKDGTNSVSQVRWGNTDCSGLASAALRYGEFYMPEEKKPQTIATKHFAKLAKANKRGLSIIGTKAQIVNNVRHGDAVNYTSSPYGHIFLFNGKMANGMMRTVEAKGSKYGVGSMVRSFNSLSKRDWHIIRSKYVYNDVKDIKKFYPVATASSVETTFNKEDVSDVATNGVSSSAIKKQIKGSYNVKSGDTGLGIAKKLGVSLSELERVNPSINWGRLSIGQKINVPGQGSDNEQSFYKVKAGDSGHKIANKLDIKLSTLKTLNPQVNWNRLSVGQVLNVPAAQTVLHTVKSGDSLSKIARQYGANQVEVRKLNGISLNSPNPSLMIGQTLKIPRS